MPDSRTHSSVAERLDLQIERVPNRMHRQRRWVTVVCGLVPLVAVAVFTLHGDHSIYLSRPVAVSHQAVQADCKSCHQTPWQPLVRLASLDNEVRSVRDKDCQQCHSQSKSDHNPFATPKGVPDCATCHQEHRGSMRLTERADEHCTKCHASFEKHPEFALHRPPRSSSAPQSESAAMLVRHLLTIAEFREPTDGEQSARWVDKAALQFNHAEHLKPLRPVSDSHAGDNSLAAIVQLQCNNCHEPDSTAAYMRPIVFEEHCNSCHPLRFSGRLSDRPLPHENPEIVHGVLRDRLMDYARKHPDELRGSNRESTSRLPNKRPPPSPKDEWTWVEEELRVIENAVFQSTAGTSPKNNACQKCHQIHQNEAGNSFQIVSPQLPTRWMMHSRFDHERHREMTCVECHHLEPRSATLESTSTKDILMPTLEVCQNCHGATRALPKARIGRKNCVECHQYHHAHEGNTADVTSR